MAHDNSSERRTRRTGLRARLKRRLPLSPSEIILIASVACLVAAAAVQAVIALAVDVSGQ